jgi:hypothetical protein
MSDQSVTGKLPFKHRSHTPDELLRPVDPVLRNGTHDVLLILAPSLTSLVLTGALLPDHRTLSELLVSFNACIVSGPRSASTPHTAATCFTGSSRMYDRVAPVP